MGLLDDAIREHLDLKRRRGAEPSEIDRLEHEALGPVRREPFRPANQDSAPQAEVDDRADTSEQPSQPSDAKYEEYYEEEYYDEADADDWAEPFEDDLERPGARKPQTEPPPPAADRTSDEPPPAPEHEAEHGFRRWRRSRRSVPPEEAPPTQAEPPAHAPGGDETVEYGVEDALDARGGTPEEGPAAGQPPEEDEADVLEETPEFLQDAPEHDRLWFEQRPPRDFDFDD